MNRKGFLQLSGIYLAQKGIDSKFFQGLKDIFGGTPDSPTGATTFEQLVTATLQILLIVAASVAVIYLIIGGYRYVTSRGNEDAAESAKKTISSAIWGLVIIILAFAIISIIARVLLEGSGGVGP